MDLPVLFEEFFIAPIMQKSGYNIVNTFAYALAALCALFAVWKILEWKKINIGKEFWAGAVGFTFFGSSLRVVIDAVDSGAMANALLVYSASGAQGGNAGAYLGSGCAWFFGGIARWLYPEILNSGIFAYSFLTVSPGMYLAVAGMFFAAMYLEKKMGARYFAGACGAALCAGCVAALLPLMQYFDYGAIIVLGAAAVAALMAFIFKLDRIEYVLPVFAHALDGAATWVSIDIFGPAHSIAYFEQHVFPSAIGEGTPFGYFAFFAIKAVFAAVVVSVIRREEDRRLVLYLLLVILIIGLAPGLRDVLRMVAGT